MGDDYASDCASDCATIGRIRALPRPELKMSETICRNLRIRGRVQGVGYRWSLCAEAQRLGLSGWVRNRYDGSVEALVRGPLEAVDALLVWAHHGPSMARVDSVVSNEGNAAEIGTRTGFAQIASR